MDPILRIIHYLFEKRGQEIKDNTFNSFFSNGISFPKFIENIFNQKVPGIIENPSNETEAISNNQNALNFLFSKNNYIANKSPNFNSEKEQVELLTLILTKQCFEIDREQIRNKCNDLIYDNSGPYFATESDCFHENFFLYLLNALTKNEVTTCTDLPDFDSILISKFREAKCPLVIDKTALKPERSFTFYIQILIMFDFFSKKENNTDEKQQNNEKQTNNEEQQNTFENILDNEYIDADDENENDFNGNSLDEVSNNNDLYKSLLLQTINKLNKCNFISLKESVEKDNIIVFAGKIMKDKKDNSFITRLIKEKTKTNDTKIKEFLKFLGEKEPIFNILSMKLNFKDDDLKENTAVLFYTKFLDYFFIKTSKQELFERCKTLLFTIKMRESDAMYKNVKYIKNQNILKVLKDFNLYMALIYFICSSKLHYSFSVVETLNNYTFQNQSVPQLFDEKQLSKCEHIISPMYYQLQLLFNKLDDKYKFKHLFIESITKCIRKLIKIRLPDIKNLASTIIMKNTALIEQHKRFKEYCKIDTTLIKKQFHDYEEKQSTNSKEQTNADSTIDSDLMKTMRGGSKGSLSSETDFWNFNDNEYKYIDLLFTNNENINEQIWKNAIIDEQNKVINVISYDKPEYVFDSIKPQKNNHPLYKFFIYNEREQKWEKNKDGIDSFKKNLEKLIPKNQIPGNKLPKNAIPKTPLVLFFNSNETDLITLNSNLIQSQYPNIYDDEIFVYALCDKPLAFLNYIIDMRNFQSNQKPIFLLLHIPEEKLKLKNIKIIIYQIYYFLSFICDIAVTVLNKKDFIDQLTLVENISTIKSKYNIEKNQMSTRNLFPRKMINDNDDNFSSDDDEINENEENEYIIDKNNDKINKELLYQLIKKKTEFIVLINNDVINANFATQTNCDFIKDIEEQFKNIHLYMININRTITYNSFLTVLTQLASNYLIEYNEVFERFDMFQMTNVYGSYVVFRLENSWSNYLKEMIEKRFMQYKDHNDENLSNYDLLNKLHDEIACTFPLFDEEYSTFCNKIITDILTKKSKKHMDIFNMELEKCSSIELLRLNNIIAKKKYLSEADKENIQKSHENFLKTKYFDILNHFFEKNELHIFFHHNYSILEQKIKQDRENINEKFKVNKQKNCTDTDEQKYTNINEQKQVGTYYTFREKESYKEKTVIVKSKDFENDFGDDKE